MFGVKGTYPLQQLPKNAEIRTASEDNTLSVMGRTEVPRPESENINETATRTFRDDDIRQISTNRQSEKEQIWREQVSGGVKSLLDDVKDQGIRRLKLRAIYYMLQDAIEPPSESRYSITSRIWKAYPELKELYSLLCKGEANNPSLNQFIGAKVVTPDVGLDKGEKIVFLEKLITELGGQQSKVAALTNLNGIT